MSKVIHKIEADTVELPAGGEAKKIIEDRIMQQPKVEAVIDDILMVNHLKMYFPVTKGLLKRQIGTVKAVDDVSFKIKKGQTLGIVGESGSGKSTIGNCVMGNYHITDGTILFDGLELSRQSKKDFREIHKKLQMITQDPYASLDPRMRISDIILEGPRYHKIYQSKQEERDLVGQQLELVGLNPKFAERYPHEFSGGQRQRISIARALALNPSFIVCDEIVSALDVSIQAQIVGLMMKIQQELGLTYIFIGHDLSVVRHLSNQVAVMYLGKIMELTDSDELYNQPLHPYTQALISAAPIPNPTVDRTRSRIMLEGEIPSPMNPPKGCNFCTRCRYATDRCREEEPQMVDVGNQHYVACHQVTGKA
jgi:oligopeptide transport system ATP-binding protein